MIQNSRSSIFKKEAFQIIIFVLSKYVQIPSCKGRDFGIENVNNLNRTRQHKQFNICYSILYDHIWREEQISQFIVNTYLS